MLTTVTTSPLGRKAGYRFFYGGSITATVGNAQNIEEGCRKKKCYKLPHPRSS
jgi:hypothetical protein